MFWSKILVSVMLIMVVFSGCAEITEGFVAGVYTKKLQNDKEALYLETVNNDEFQKAFLAKKLKFFCLDKYFHEKSTIIFGMNGLKQSDILLLDNAGNEYLTKGGVHSSKILLTKENIFIIYMINRGEKFNYKDADYGCKNTPYWYRQDVDTIQEVSAKITDDKVLHLEKNVNFYQQGSFRITIKSRYNDIEKIKSIIDERVEYFKKLQADSAQK